MRVRVFRREGNNQYYFQFLRDDGQVILNSEGYTTEAARDNGLEAVIANAGNAERYEILTNEGGRFYFVLKAANGQEIGRSVTFRTAESRATAVSLLQTEGTQIEWGQKKEAPYEADGQEDNYKPLNFYEARITGVENGFDSFTEGDLHYFTYNLGGNVYLISEGYTTTGARDNGINSVTTNMNNPDRYQREVHPNGKSYFNLRAGNNKEIATSRWFDSRGNMDSVIARMIAGIGLSGVRVEEGTQLEAANRNANITIAAPPEPAGATEPKKKRKKRTTPKKPKAEKEYVANGSYLFNDITWDIFKSSNNRYYFTFKNPEGKTIFLNADVRGFETQEAAQEVVDQIMLYAPYEANFDGKMARNGKYYFYIKGADGTNIGKSFFYNSAEDMQAAVGTLLGNEVQIAALEEARRSAANIDEYLECSAYAGPDGFHKFKYEENGEFYFAYNFGGKTYLRSEGYTTEKARDNGIASVIKNAPLDERWKTLQDEEDGRWYYALRAGNHQEIARSCGYDSAADRDVALAWLRGEESTIGAGAQLIDGVWYSAGFLNRKRAEEEAAEAAKKAAEAAAALAAAKNIDEYLECSAYEADVDGFHTFKNEENGEFYFSYIGNGKVLLRSEGYTTSKARDNGIASVIKNAPLDERWKTLQDEEDDRWYYALRAGNNQEIARSCGYDSEALMLSSWNWLRGEESTLGRGAQFVDGAWYSAGFLRRKREEEEAAAAAKKAAEAAALAAAAKNIDEYLACSAYEADVDGFHTFKNEENGEYYFSYIGDGKVLLRSEGYTTPKARDNGIASVRKNAPLDERWKTLQDEDDNRWYYSLRAGNNQEIARSCGYDSEALMLGSWNWLRGEKSTLGKGAALVGGVWYSGWWLQKKKEEEAQALALAAKAAEAKKDKEDDYLSCKYYENHPINDKINNVAFFKHDGQYYFVMYEKDGRVKLRSEGFRTAQERDQELSGVVRLHDKPEFYKKIEKGKYYMNVLYDETGREVGRSCLRNAEAEAAALAALAAKKDKEDDYLSCKFYENHSVNDKINNVAFFKHDGQYYFVMYEEDGRVKLRSEGFRTAQERDQELSGVVRLHDKSEFYKKIEKGKYYMNVLYDETGREVGRSCLRNAEEEAAALAALALAEENRKKEAAAAAAAAAALALATRKKEEEAAAAALLVKQQKEKERAAAAAAALALATRKKEEEAAAAALLVKQQKEKERAAAAAAAPVAAATEGSGTMGWLPWLLLPLLLLGALWLSRGCYGCGEEVVIPPPISYEAPVVAPKTTPPPPPTCSCDGNSENDIFNIPTDKKPKELTRLGTNPEFGNAHGLTGPQFLGRLRNRHATGKVDEEFLDNLFMAMGYANGFADAKATMFSEVTLPNGKTGNMGYSENHKTSYMTLNAADSKDLEAFKIEAANGCDMYFMKTCGNHFFFCN